WTWLGGPSPGLCHATMTEAAPPVASVVRSTSMSRPKGLIDNACLGVTTAGCNGVCASMDVVSSSSRPSSSTRLASPEPQPCLISFVPSAQSTPGRGGRRSRGLPASEFLLRWAYDKPLAFEAIEIMCGDRSEIVRASHAPGEPDGVEEER